MARFGGPVALKKSPKTSRSQSPPKRRPFVSTAKGASGSFGVPPPLPPVVHFEHAEIEQEQVVDPQTAVVDRDNNLDANCMVTIQQMTPRWLNLTISLWGAIVADANRSVDKIALRNFVDAMEWRISGEVSEFEFLGLYNEWMASGFPLLKKRNSVGLTTIRSIFIEKNLYESELDLLLGLMIFENSRSLLNTPLYFAANAANVKENSTLEVCSRKWLALSEELFFLLDSPGYGCLQFDQLFFLSACLSFGIKSWSDESEIESDLSIGILTAITSSIMKDALPPHSSIVVSGGPGLAPTPELISRSDTFESSAVASDVGLPSPRSRPSMRRSSSIDSSVSNSDKKNAPDGPPGLAGSSSQAGASASQIYAAVTLPMFKRFLIKMGICEAPLVALVSHVRSCVAVISGILMSWSSKPASRPGSTAALQACYTAAGQGFAPAAVGPPRLWQHNVMKVSGRSSSSSSISQQVPNGSGDSHSPGALVSDSPQQYRSAADALQLANAADPVPYVLSFLVTEGDRMIPMAWRAFPENISAFDAQNASIHVTGMPLLHSTVWKLFKAYKRSSSAQGGSQQLVMASTASSNDPKSVGMPSAENRRDPVYQFILACLVEYKASQLALCGAFVEAALQETVRGCGSGLVDSAVSGVTALACASLIPRGEAIMRECQVYERMALGHSANQLPRYQSPLKSSVKRRGSNWDAFSSSADRLHTGEMDENVYSSDNISVGTPAGRGSAAEISPVQKATEGQSADEKRNIFPFSSAVSSIFPSVSSGDSPLEATTARAPPTTAEASTAPPVRSQSILIQAAAAAVVAGGEMDSVPQERAARPPQEKSKAGGTSNGNMATANEMEEQEEGGPSMKWSDIVSKANWQPASGSASVASSSVGGPAPDKPRRRSSAVAAAAPAAAGEDAQRRASMAQLQSTIESIKDDPSRDLNVEETVELQNKLIQVLLASHSGLEPEQQEQLYELLERNTVDNVREQMRLSQEQLLHPQSSDPDLSVNWRSRPGSSSRDGLDSASRGGYSSAAAAATAEAPRRDSVLKAGMQSPPGSETDTYDISTASSVRPSLSVKYN
jgi:hypothetical protein